MHMSPRTVVAPRRSAPRSRSNVPPFDYILVVATIMVSLVGVVMVYTATRGPLLAQGEDPHAYLKKQALYVVLGIIVMIGVALFDYRRLEPIAMVLYALTILALLGVYVVGSSAQGAARWFNVGPLQLQPSEFAVLAVILAIASYCDKRDEGGLAWRDVFRLLTLAAFPIALVMGQPDLGTAMIMLIVLLVLLAVAGLPIRILVFLLIGTVLVALFAVETGILHHYQIARLTTFLNPNNPSNNRYVKSAVYNLQEAKNAIGSGGLLGSGIGHGAQTNLGYVPEQQTDFIFTAVGEQLGFFGAAGLLSLLGVIAWRILRAAGSSRDIFGRLVCTGLFAFLAFSVFQNAGMTMGIMPITGIPLPFVSYGGTAVICFFAAVGLALSVGARRRLR
jgi:rod shape determining protein RodA